MGVREMLESKRESEAVEPGFAGAGRAPVHAVRSGRNGPLGWGIWIGGLPLSPTSVERMEDPSRDAGPALSSPSERPRRTESPRLEDDEPAWPPSTLTQGRRLLSGLCLQTLLCTASVARPVAANVNYL